MNSVSECRTRAGVCAQVKTFLSDMDLKECEKLLQLVLQALLLRKYNTNPSLAHIHARTQTHTHVHRTGTQWHAMARTRTHTRAQAHTRLCSGLTQVASDAVPLEQERD